MMPGSLNRLTGSDARSSQASELAVPGSGAQDRRCWGLKACPYRAARTLPGGGLRPVSLVSSGVTVARASARLARECGVRCGHFTCAYATAGRVEPGAAAGCADQLGAVAVGQRPGHERPGPVAAGYPPADLKRLPAGPAPDREDPDIERIHGNSPLEMTRTTRSQP